MSDRSLVTWTPDALARPLLLCLPPAGAGCGQFQEWQRRLAPDLAVAGVQLPGREERWQEPAATSLDGVVGEVVAALAGRPAGLPLVIFGYSFGGLLAYETARRLGRDHCGRPAALVVAACRPPHLWSGARQALVDEELELDRMLAARGIDPATLDQDTRRALLAPLQHDTELSRTYRHRDDHPLECPVWVWGGDQDPTVTPAQLAGWRAYAAGRYSYRLFAGDHYFVVDHLDRLLGELRELARPGLGAERGAA